MMDKLGLGVMVCMALTAGCGKPELGLGDLKGGASARAGGSAGGAAGSTQGAEDGTGGKGSQDGTGGTAQVGTGGNRAQDSTGGAIENGTGGKRAQEGSGGSAEDSSGGKGTQGGSGGSVQPEGGSGGKGQLEPGCYALSESECEMSQSCSPIHGSDDGTLPGTVFAGCQPTGLSCPAVVQCAYPAGEQDGCLVLSGCLPQGWIRETDCAAQGCPPLPGQNPGTGGSGAGGAGSAGAGSSAGAGNSGGAGNDCALATPEELASTPREDTNLEQLALRHSDGIVADQDVYDRVVRDITAIRDQAADIADIDYWPPNDGKSLLLVVDGSTWDAMQADSYTDWDCLLDGYPVTDIQYEKYTSLDMFTVQIELRGIYRLDPIAAQFAGLTGVSSAEASMGIGDGPTICLTQSDSVWHYVFDRAGGDCPAGCTTHAYAYFTVSSDGATIERVGAWSDGSSSPAPDWVTEYASREACR
jgi:hypothetical protein